MIWVKAGRLPRRLSCDSSRRNLLQDAMSTDQIIAISAITAPFVLFMIMLGTVCWLESRP